MDYAFALSTVTYASPAALEHVRAIAPWLEMTYSRTVGCKYLANPCNNCGALQGDFFLRSEPGGAFFPMDDDERARIQIQWIEMPIYVDSGEIGIDTEWVD